MARLYFGRKSGGVARLAFDAEVTLGLAIGEGIETSASALCCHYPAWAALDAGNLAAFPVLPGIEALTLLVDHDDAGHRAAASVAARWLAAGREVRAWSAPDDARKSADLNDLLRELGHG
jgi:hypothetical protein